MRASLKRSLLTMLGFAALGWTGATAGSFTSDFSDPAQAGLSFGSNFAARPDSSTFQPAIESGRLTLTYAEPGENGSVVLADLDGGAAVSAFTATFKVRIGGGTSNPGDGLAFYFGTDVFDGAVFGEEGPDPSANGLAVCFDIYNNGANEAPAIDVKVNGVLLGHYPINIFTLLSDTFVDVSIQLKPNGTLTVVHRGATIFNNLFLHGYAPAAGSRFALGARTGAEYANHWVDDLSITTTLAGAPSQPSITTPPASVSVNEGQPASFQVAWAGSMPFTFQWLKNDAPIDSATNETYSIAAAAGGDNGAVFKCVVTNPQGSATSAGATLTVIVDNIKPTLVSARGSDTFDKVTVVFSEPVEDATAQNPANYALTGATVTAAVKVNATTVALTTTKHAEGATLTLTVNNVRDMATNPNAIEANSTIQLKSFVFSPGFAKLDVYDGVDGSAVAVLYEAPAYLAGTPSRTMFGVGFDSDAAPMGLDGVNENYGAVLYGYVIPAQTGSYRFFSRSDDGSELFLNPGGIDPAGAILIAQETGCCNGFLEAGNQQTSEAYALNAGTRYFLKLNFKEGTGGDFGQVAWRREGDSTAAGLLTPIAGKVMGWFADPTGTSISIATQPASTSTTENKTATFTVAATGVPGPVWYQWQRAEPGSGTFADIAGARGATFTTAAMKRATDNGAKYRAVVYTPGASLPSAEATLSVEIDSTGPSVLWAVTKANNKGVTLKFSEPLAGAAAGNAAAYSIAGLNVTGAQFVSADMVVLTTSPMTEGAVYTVVVANAVTDVAIPPNGVSAPNNTATVKGGIKVSGASKFEIYRGIGGTAVTDFTGNAKYPFAPDTVALCNGMEGQSWIHVDDNYGGRLSGFFVAPADGDYVFYIASDDGGALYVSTNDDPDNKVLVATEPQYGDPRAWTGNAAGRRPGCDTGDCENISEAITMVGGQAYYLELLFKEGGGNDHGAVRVQLAGDAPPEEGSFLPPLMGSGIYTIIDPDQLDRLALPLALRSALGSGTADGFRAKTVQAEQLGATGIPDQYNNFEQIFAGILGPNVANMAGAVNGFFTVDVVNFNSDTAAEEGFFTSADGGLYQSTDRAVPGIPGVGAYGGNADRARRNYAQEVVSYVEFPAPGVYYFGVNSENGFRASVGEEPPADNGALVVHGTSAAAGTYYALNSGSDVGGISKPMTQKIEGKLVLANSPGAGGGTAACAALDNADAIRGNIAVVERGVCVFSGKLTASLDAGAIAVVVINSRDPGSADGVWPIVMGGTYVDIPAVMVSKPDGIKIKNALLAGETIHASITPLLDPGLSYYRRGRSSFETRFSAYVKEAGLYPIRMMWYYMNGDGAVNGDCEFFSHNSADDFILINDRAKVGSLRTFKTRDFTALIPTIQITRTETSTTITYTGVLQSCDTVNGTYTDVIGATSPRTLDASGTAKFYRTRGL